MDVSIASVKVSGVPYWIEKRDGRWVLCRQSHPDIQGDSNVDFVDCEFAFEPEPWEES